MCLNEELSPTNPRQEQSYSGVVEKEKGNRKVGKGSMGEKKEWKQLVEGERSELM